MAIVRAYYSVDMGSQLGSDNLYYFGQVTVATSSYIQIRYGGEVLNYYGSFNYNNATGTLTSFNYTYFGNKVFELSGGSWDLLTALNHLPYIDNYILRGADKLYGSFEDDVLIGYGGNDVMYGNGGNDELYGYAGNDTIFGGGGDDLLSGGGGNDKLNGGAGADTMQGGTGNDVYYVNSISDSVVENPGAGADLVNSTITYTLGENVENLVLQGNNSIDGTGNELDNSLTGNAADNTLSGLAGNDRLNGLAGADTMFGGLGDDIYFVDNAGDVVTENFNEGNDKVNSYISFTLRSNVEKLVLLGSNTINATGNELDNVLVGNNQANTLDGNSGDDTMRGRAGNDIYIIDSAGDTVIEQANQGIDWIQSAISYTLDTYLEKLTLTGADDLSGTGNAVNNVIEGNVGDNTLRGLAGQDILRGYDGNDTLIGGGGHDRLIGGAGDDILIGSTGNDILMGGLNDDILVGGIGDDKLYGDSGTDTASYSDAASGVVVNLGLTSAQNTISAGHDFLSDIENLIGSNYHDRLIGNSLNNEISGGSGADQLYGRAGNDILSGGSGRDLLLGNAGDDILIGDAGNDTIRGGTGADIIILNSLSGIDDILDFSPDEDLLQLDQSIFTGLFETDDELDSSDFVTADVLTFNEVLSGASILYEKSTGSIYYDADGGTADNATLIATVTDWLTLSNTNIDLI